MKSRSILMLFLFKCLLLSCDVSFSDLPEAEVPGLEAADAGVGGPPAVRVSAARRSALPLRTIATGTLRAARRVELHARVSGELLALPVREGAPVEAGALIASVDETPFRFRLLQARIRLADAANSKDALLLAQGGRAGVDSSVSAEKLELIDLLSGYDQARLELEQAGYELSETKVTAPYSGVIADVRMQVHQQVSSGEVICTLIDPSSFEAEFRLLENEALQVREGQPVRVRPLALAGREWVAEVCAINPVVSDQGLVTLRARLKGDARRLLEGLNLEVVLERRVSGHIVIPKSAVLLRSGRSVVFTYDAGSGLAKWRYVTVACENEEQAAVSEGLEAGELVIWEGNVNLDHHAAVSVDP